ncbi:MAG TPA: serine--tRNA ligase [Candidatus Marinimicrobia bacterium]|nr:serine--tRNA ligase [Candidatus Neomarinimicrobiota bacterium]
MLSLTRIRNNPDQIKAGLEAKNESIDLDKILKLDEKHRDKIHQLNEMRAERNRASEAIAEAKRAGKDSDDAIAAMRKGSDAINDLEKEVSDLGQTLNEQLELIPNIPHDTVPVGQDETANQVIREWGDPLAVDFDVKSHVEIGLELKLFDFERGSKISGSGFPLLTGLGAKLERVLINFMLELHVQKHGFTEIFPPFLTRAEAPRTCGQLPKFADDMYYIEKDDLYLIPTAEVPVTYIFSDEIMDEDDLPVNYAAYSACFRREAGSYGKGTRGLLRLHQFNKVEMVKFVEPKTSYDELESLTTQAEEVLQQLGLHYRVVALSTGDLSFAAAKCYDLEVWAPGEGKWLEVSSCSNYEDFQARRGNIRYRRIADKIVDFVHTLNGSGLATPRLMVALLESYQTPDGKVLLPQVLHEPMGQEVLG